MVNLTFGAVDMIWEMIYEEIFIDHKKNVMCYHGSVAVTCLLLVLHHLEHLSVEHYVEQESVVNSIIEH